MRTKIKEALQQEYKNLGLNDEAFEGVAAFGETLEINEESLANFVKGAKDLLKREQSNADKLRNVNATSTKQVEDLRAKLAEAEAKLNKKESSEGAETKVEQPDFAKLISDAVTAAVQPLQAKIAEFEGAKSAEEAFNAAKTKFFENEYAKKYVDERDAAWERAVEINEAMGSKMTAEELQTKAMGYFAKAVAKKGEDVFKPFKSEGANDDKPNFKSHVEYLKEAGKVAEENKQE